MAELALTVETLSDGPVDFNVSSDTTVRETAEKIRVWLNYPVADPNTSEVIDYYLVNDAGERIDDNAQLDAAGIHSGDRIGIRTSMALQPEPIPTPSTLTPPGKLCLAIKMIGRSKPAIEQFDSDISVGELLTEMIDKYVLPSHYDNSIEPIIYAISSIALSRQLQSAETLRNAGVPDWDTLTILTDNKAGGASRAKVDGAKSRKESERRVSLSICGVPLTELSEVSLQAIISNEPALLMMLHAYKASLVRLEDALESSSEELTEEKRRRDHLENQVRARNIGTALLVLGQIEVGFATNLITNNQTHVGWFLFAAGLAVNLFALYFSFFSVRKVDD